MGVRRDLLLRFLLLYGMLYCSFGLSSPFLPAFLAARGIGSEWLGFLLGGGTAVRLLSAPFAGRLADVFGAFLIGDRGREADPIQRAESGFPRSGNPAVPPL